MPVSSSHLADYSTSKTMHASVARVRHVDVARCQHTAVVVHHAEARLDLDVAGRVAGERDDVVHTHRDDARWRYNAFGAFIERVQLFLALRLQQCD